MMKANLFANILPSFPEEIIENLVEAGNFRLERIVSRGHTTPPEQWYDQSWDEWVVLLTGSATLLFEGEEGTMLLQPGDFVHIPAHTRHRVEHTDDSQATVWLALHYASQGVSATA
jgi:cupin 2 domain-containing protein